MKRINIFLLVIILILGSFFISGCGLSKNGKKSKSNIYDMKLIYDEETFSVNGEMDFTFCNNYENAFKCLKFNLFPNAYRKDAKYKAVSDLYLARAYYDGESYGEIKINSVKSGDEELNYGIIGEDDNILSVELKKEVFPNEKVIIHISFTTVIPKVKHRLGVNEIGVNLSDFYPILCGYDNGFYECIYYNIGDPFYSEVADYNVTIKLNKEFVVASSGEMISLKEENGKNIISYKLNNCRDFAFCLSKKFQVISKNVGNTKVNYYYYEEEAKVAEEYLDTAIKAIETFNKLFGDYPFNNYNVVKTSFVQSGMEYSGICYISELLSQKEFNEVIIHETAHQWWYGVVGNNQIESGFLDEGLAEYSVVLFYEKNPEYEYTREMCMDIALSNFKSFCTVYDMLFKKVDTSMLRPLKAYSSEYEYVNIAYMKTAIMYDELRKGIGEKKFFEGLKKYYNDYYMKNAKPYDLVGVYEKIGAATNGFFESYFDGTVLL